MDVRLSRHINAAVRFGSFARLRGTSVPPSTGHIDSSPRYVRLVPPDSDMGTFEIADKKKAARGRLFNSNQITDQIAINAGFVSGDIRSLRRCQRGASREF
jgi:hypothetical protein